MNEHDGVAMGVNVFVDAYDPVTGAYLGRRAEVHNLVTDAGLNWFVDLATSNGAAGFSHFVLGDGAQKVARTDTALPSEKYRDVPTQTARDNKAFTLKYYLGSLYGNGITYTKAGLMGTTGAVLVAAVDFGGIAKTNAEAWTFTWVWTLKDLSL